MTENLVIEMSNGVKYTVIDILEYNKETYFLLTLTSKDETKISDQFEICKYDKIHNNFDKIEYEDEYEFIKKKFDERLEKEKIEISIVNRIDFDELLKLEVLSVKKYDYKLKHEEKTYTKNIEFYSKTKPQKGDYIYISRNTLEEDMLTYGHIHNIDALNHNNVLVIEKNEKRVYLLRYYG